MPAHRIKLDPTLERRYAKQAKKRNPRQIICKILIVCEGTKTEPFYFEAFKSMNRGTQIYDIEIAGTAANTLNVVDKAIELRKKAKENGEEYDRVWAVFDKDSFPDNNFNSAILKARANDIECAWSNEAFELWYLYHFKNVITGLHRNDYADAISDAVNNSPKYKHKKKYRYQKADKENYCIMNHYGSQESAIKYAERKSKEYNDNRFAKHNPCTMVFKLVRQLIGQDQQLNQELAQKI